jgi:phage-related tail fiber protein
MIDLNSQFFAILTKVGEAKQANADALGIPWNISQMGVGDAHGTDPIPDRLQTKLINERRRAPLNQLMIDPLNPSVLIAEQVIPADVGGWWVREIGLYDADGDLVAVANCAPSFKPMLSQGSGRTQIVRMNFIISSITNVVLKIDPAIVLATREYVDRSIDAVLPADKKAGTYTQVTINSRGIVVSGKSPTTLAGYGITDALPNKNPLPGGSIDIHGDYYAFLTSPLESSVAQNCYWNGTAWYRHDISRPAVCITLDDGRFSVRRVGAGQNPIVWQTMSPVWDASNAKFSGLLERPTTLSGYSIGDAFTKAETSAIVDAAIARLIGSAPGAVDTIEELARALNNNPNFATDIINGLATKAAKATTLQGYGIGDAYTQSEINQLLSGKAAKATTLAGYGITNGLVDKNPLPGGSVDIHGDTYAFLTSPLESSVCQNCYWNGTAWYRHDSGQPAVSVTVSGGGALVRTAPAGAGPIVWAFTEPLWTSKNATVSSSGGVGTLKLPNGWVQQIFEVTESTSASDVRYFPVSFPSECFGVFPVLLSSTSGGYGTNVGVVVGDVTKDRFLINAGGSFSGEGRFRVLALGR